MQTRKNVKEGINQVSCLKIFPKHRDVNHKILNHIL